MSMISADLPFFSLIGGPTPLQEMNGLRNALLTETKSCPRLFIKRDDLTGLAGGGNKTRKLEYLIGDALAKKATSVVTAGAIQSNHARQTAAAAAKAGLQAHLILFDTVSYDEPAYRVSGNLLLDQILGATVRIEDKHADAMAVFEEVLNEISADNGQAYVIPVGGSNAIGSTGYAAAFLEIEAQAKSLGITVNQIIHATSSLGTQSGLLAGQSLSKSSIGIQSINVAHETQDTLADKTLELANATAKRIGADPLQVTYIHADFRHLGEGYGLPTEGTISAIELVARTEGILLDPVYSGKAMSGLISKILAGEFNKEETLVFLHTGGMPGLFAYPSQFGKT